MVAPNPTLLRLSFKALDAISNATTLRSEPGRGPWVQSKDSQVHYDYIILGGGAAGSVLAARLAEDPKVNVLILEAGYSDEHPSSRWPIAFMLKFRTSTDWNFQTVPQPHANGRVMAQPRGKLIGGTSAINAMMYHRGPKDDFNLWEKLGNPGWNYARALHYFKKSEGFNDPSLPASHPRGPKTSRVRHPEFETFDPNYHGTEGPWQVSYHAMYESSKGFIRANIAEDIALNRDINGESTLGVNKVPTFIQTDGVRSSLSRAFLKPEGVVPGGGKRGTIRIVYGAKIQRVLVQDRLGSKVCIGVEFLDAKKVLRRITAVRETILCAGAFGSPHILLQSGIGPVPHPLIPHVHTLPGIGQHLADHLGLGIVFKANDKCHTLQDELKLFSGLSTLMRYLMKGTGAISAQGGETFNFVRLEQIAPEFVAREKELGTWKDKASGPEAPHLEVIFAPVYARRHASILAPDSSQYYMLILLLLNPISEGTVKISARPNKNGKYETVIDPNYYADPFDVRVMAEGVKFIRRLGRHMQMDSTCGGVEVFPGEENVKNDDTVAMEAFIRDASDSYYHPTSTCRMGPTSDKDAVVNARLNVYGVDRLRIVDASVMPQLPAAHTCAPTVMIAETAADMIKEDWSSRPQGVLSARL